MKRLILPALALALAACGKGPVTPTTPGVLSGTVLDTLSGLVPVTLAGAKVVVGSTDSTTTDANGRFLLSLSQGRYTVQVTRDGYYGVAVNVPVVSKDTTRITVFPALRPWLPGTAMPEARHNFAMAQVLNEIYVIAGVGVFGGSTTRYTSLLSYGPGANLWTTVGYNNIPVHREMAACAALGNKIYVFGGTTGANDTTLCHSCDIPWSFWTQFPTPLPRACRAMAAVTVGDSIYVIGGISGGAALDSVRIYKPSADSTGGTPWRTAANMPAARGGASAVFVGGNIYVFGGASGGAAQSSVFRYSPAANTWSTMANMPAARAYMACAAVGNMAYLFGGWDAGSARNGAARYNTAANSWTVLSDMPTARYGAGCTVHGNRVYIFGGFDGTNSQTVVEIYNPLADPAK